MITRLRIFAFLAAFAAAGTLPAQGQLSEMTKDVVVRTFMLQNLSPADAAKLVTPYVDFTPFGGVFLAGDAIRGITVRGLPAVVARADSLLKANDRPAESVRLTFQLIAALDSSVQDPAIAAVDEELRRVFKFRGYRLLAQGVVVALARHNTNLTLASGRSDLDQYQVVPWIERIDQTAGKGGVMVRVRLNGPSVLRTNPATGSAVMTIASTLILESSITVPFGQTVILGSGSSMGGRAPGSALILTVRPEVIPRP